MGFQILPPNPRRSFGEKLSQGVGQGLNMAQQMYADHQQKEAVKRLMGADVAEITPELQKLYIGQQLQGQNRRAVKS